MKRQFAKNVYLDCIKVQTDNWAKGEASIGKKLFYFEIKHFDEPSQFGIQNGRISKLHITEFRYIKGDEIAYDRGWCSHWRKAPKEMQAVYRAILKKYN